jgi:hypothetical protein
MLLALIGCYSLKFNLLNSGIGVLEMAEQLGILGCSLKIPSKVLFKPA